MLEIIICLALHCAISFALKYCCDKEIIWHNNESPKLHMPRLCDLDENCDVYTQQKYVDEVIIPSNAYFSMVSEISNFQEDDSGDLLIQLIIRLPAFLLVANAFRKADFFDFLWLNSLLAVVVCVAIIFVVSFIYNRTNLKLGSFKLSLSDIKKDFDYVKKYSEREFDMPEENALNNFIIKKHHSYISCIHYTIEKRYRLKKILETIAGWIYVLFIMRLPD